MSTDDRRAVAKLDVRYQAPILWKDEEPPLLPDNRSVADSWLRPLLNKFARDPVSHTLSSVDGQELFGRLRNGACLPQRSRSGQLDIGYRILQCPKLLDALNCGWFSTQMLSTVGGALTTSTLPERRGGVVGRHRCHVQPHPIGRHGSTLSPIPLAERRWSGDNV